MLPSSSIFVLFKSFFKFRICRYAPRSLHESDNLDSYEWGFTPKCLVDDAERFKDCDPLTLKCISCQQVCILVNCSVFR